ncbi:hexitol phosphatase HxpB [Segetibacter aerophilus]|uniref:2-deoxyglucose-6-phosphatase n=1 Tax=Segetibacter aerophilus TaxID=670293 RepID=A0A512B9G6_9BACT|nr:hexitol phosphatase HxpB [Segetibacter aerophilus]GEO08608.1 2-deoxyglucose-6-phosphatase [Segetibacter aerophilus]
MNLNTVIFDMDGLLIDSEPLWTLAAAEVFETYGKRLTPADFASTTGLRTSEFVAWWLRDYKFDDTELEKVATRIVELVTRKIRLEGKAMPGMQYIFDFFQSRGYKVGLATSSPMSVADTIIDMLGIEKYLGAKTSAEKLEYGKPHPQVYLDCAKALQSSPLECICFEDSVNGMIAAKAARMKCVVVPTYSQQKDEKWSIADLKISSLKNFSELHINLL